MSEVVYCQEIDTLFIRLPGFGKLHVVCPLADDIYALFDVETLEIVGFQVENWKKHLDNFRGMVRPSD